MGQTSSQPIPILSQQPIKQDEHSHEDSAEIQYSLGRKPCSPAKELLDISGREDFQKFVRPSHISASTSNLGGVQVSAMDGTPTSSGRKRERRRKKFKATKSRTKEDRSASSPPYNGSNKSPNGNLMQTPSKNHFESSAAKSYHINAVGESLRTPTEARLKRKKRDRKGVLKERSQSKPAYHVGTPQSLHNRNADSSSSKSLASTPLLARLDALSPTQPHIGATPKSNKKRNRRKKQKVKEERPDLELLESSPTGHGATIQASEPASSTTAASSKSRPSKKRKASDNLAEDEEAGGSLKSRQNFMVTEHQGAHSKTPKALTQQNEALPSQSSKKKRRSRSQVTVSDLTQFNMASQNFKSAKIKHDQDLEANSAKHSFAAAGQASAHQSTTSTHSPSRASSIEDAIQEDNSSLVEEKSDENDNYSSNQQFPEVKIESPEPTSSISNLSQNFETIQQDDANQVPFQDYTDDSSSDSAHTNESLEEAVGQRSSTSTVVEQQIAVESPKQKKSKRKRSRKDELDTSQPSKKSRKKEVLVSAQQDVKEVDRSSTSSVASSRSESPRMANNESPVRNPAQPRHRKTSLEKPRHKTIRSKPRTNIFKSAEFIVNSDSEEATQSTDTEKLAVDQHSRSSDNDDAKTPSPVSRELSQDNTDQDDRSSSSSGSSDDDTGENITTILEEKSAIKPRIPRRLPILQTASKSDISTIDSSSTNGKEKKPIKNYMDGNRKMGQFDNQEQEKIKAFEKRYRAVHGLSEAEFLNKINGSAHNNKDLQAIWLELQDELPGRDRKSIQRHCRRKRPAAGTVTSIFTNEDDQQLMDLVVQYDKSWVKIGRDMDRTADVVRDRYRNVLKDKATRSTLKWTDAETEELKRAVGKTAAQALEKNPGIQDPYELLIWGSISEEMKGKRGRAQCSHKWKALRKRGASVVTEMERAAERMNLRIDLSRIKRDDTDTQADPDPGDDENVEDSDDGNTVPATKSKTKLKDRLQG